jgi:hypothetical protein
MENIGFFYFTSMHWCVDVVFWHFGIISIAFVSLCGLLGLLLLLLFVG